MDKIKNIPEEYKISPFRYAITLTVMVMIAIVCAWLSVYTGHGFINKNILETIESGSPRKVSMKESYWYSYYNPRKTFTEFAKIKSPAVPIVWDWEKVDKAAMPFYLRHYSGELPATQTIGDSIYFIAAEFVPVENEAWNIERVNKELDFQNIYLLTRKK